MDVRFDGKSKQLTKCTIMKIKKVALFALIISVASIPTICFANIGDTQEQSDAKYGAPIATDNSQRDIVSKAYKTQGWSIVADFISNKCERIIYFKSDESAPSTDEIMGLLHNNIPVKYNVQQVPEGILVKTDSITATYNKNNKHLGLFTPLYKLFVNTNEGNGVKGL